MAPKCNACGRFLAAAEGVACPKCQVVCHRACVNLPPDVQVHRSWLCPECTAKKPRANNDSTPIRRAGAGHILDHSMEDTTATDTTMDMRESDFFLETRAFREEMRLAREECRAWRQEMVDLRQMVLTIDERLGKLEQRVETLDKRMAAGGVQEGANEAIKALETTVNQLKIELDERDQDLLQNDVDIAGIAEEEGESVQHLVLACAAKLGVSLDDRDIVKCSRVGVRRLESQEAPKPRVITVRLARRSTRDDILKAARVRRNTTTEGLGLRAPPRPLYVNDRLTRLNRHLFNRARELARKAGWRFVWTRDGRVYIRREQGAPASRVRSDADLERVFGSDVVSS